MSVINTNTKALAAQGSLNQINKRLETAMERLSTGLRINNAADDAAGLAISNRMTSEIRGMAMATRNANDGISMAQTADGAIGEVTSILQRMRELAVQASNGTQTAENRAATQVEIAQLITQIDKVADQTYFNGLRLLDGQMGQVALQVGVNHGDTMNVSFDSVASKDIGLGQRPSLTAQGYNGVTSTMNKSLSAGDLVLNGVVVGASLAADDGKSSALNSSSAIAKVAAINRVSSQTGVTATVGKTQVAGAGMTAGGAASATATITLNGISISVTTVANDTSASRAAAVAAINAKSAQTGVVAEDTGNDTQGVRLTATDGRNITVNQAAADALLTGVVGTAGADNTWTGTYSLQSDTGGNIAVGTQVGASTIKSGLTAGTYKANTTYVTSTVRAAGATTVAPSSTTTGVLTDGVLSINGVSIRAASGADDLASDATATSSTKAASAIAIAAAINASKDQTGVSASASPTIVTGTAFSNAAAGQGDFHVNNVAISLTSLAAGAYTLEDVAALVNRYTGQTGVVASVTGSGGLTYTAADGRNISLAVATAADDAVVGLDGSSAIKAGGTAAAAVTTYGKVTLSSDKQFSVSAGTTSGANANLNLLGFLAGVYGGTTEGGKVADVNVSSQKGAMEALDAIDAAITSVSFSRARVGAYQNRLDAIVSVLDTASQNLSASRSRILDTDYATETSNLAKSQIIQQAATAMLAQANQSAQTVLSLLK